MSVRLAHDLQLPAHRAFELVADARTHGTWVPLARVDLGVPHEPGAPSADAWAPGHGATFTSVSGPRAQRGGGGFVDRMRITAWDPPANDTPGRAEFRKLGPVLLGTAGFEITPTSTSSCRVEWWEDVYITDVVPRVLTAPFADLVLTAMIRSSWRRLDALAPVGGADVR